MPQPASQPIAFWANRSLKFLNALFFRFLSGPHVHPKNAGPPKPLRQKAAERGAQHRAYLAGNGNYPEGTGRYRLLQNLLDNALRFTPPCGRITVRLLPPAAGQTRVGVEVQDTGPGIAPADLPHVFDRCRRWAGPVGPPSVGSVGLGLAIARRIVELHGGALTVSSVEGRGTCFAFSVPVSTAMVFKVILEPGNGVGCRLSARRKVQYSKR